MEKGFVICALILLKFNSIYGQGQQSPCPQYFQYQFDGNQWYGLIEIQSSPEHSARLDAGFSLRAQLPSKYVGAIELVGPKQEALRNLISGRLIRYIVRFPLSEPIPKLTSLVYNKQVLCTGPPEYGGYITTIKLDYSLYAETKSTSFLGIVQNTALQFFNPRPQQQQHQNPYYEINIDGQNENNDGSNFYRPPVNIPNNFNNDIKIYRQNPSANTPDRFKNNNYFGNQNLNIIQPSMMPTYNQQGQQNNFNNVNYNYNSNQQGTNPQQHGNQNTQYQPFVQQQSQTQPPTLQTTTTPRPTLPAYDINNESLNNICGTPVRAPKPLVFGGAPITHGEWPWIVALYIKNLGNVNYHCGGTIISKKIVITAAHCTNERDRDPYKSTEIVAFFGRQNIVEWSGQDFKSSDIREIHTHPGYRSESLSYDNDISILVMKSTIYYSRFIRPICLWAFSKNIRNIENQVGIVVGWGRDENGKITPEAKRVEAPIVPEAKCLRADESYRYITSNRTFCAGGRKGEGPCNGDSGGGLVLQYGNKWYLRGVVSVTVPDPETKTCNLGNYVVYTDVAQYDSWIGTIMEGHDSN